MHAQKWILIKQCIREPHSGARFEYSTLTQMLGVEWESVRARDNRRVLEVHRDPPRRETTCVTDTADYARRLMQNINLILIWRTVGL